MSESCDCEKSTIDENWPSKGDYGDNFLGADKFYIIKSIKKFIRSNEPNEDAYFNIELEEEILDDIDIENTFVDYSYLKEDDNPIINQKEIILTETEKEKDDSTTEVELKNTTSDEIENTTTSMESNQELENTTSMESNQELENKVPEEIENTNFSEEIESYLDELK